MPTTYTPLANSTLSSSSPTVTFSGISGAYTDLILIVNAQSTQATTYDNLIIQFNSDTGTNYSRQRLNGFSGGATADRSSNATSLGIGAITGTSFSSSIFSPNIIQIQNYSNTTTFKTVLWRNNSQDAYVQAGVGTWRNTNAITSISIKTASGSNLAAGCTFSLYGVASASVAAQGAKATGGDTIATDGTYWYHAFKASGTFTPTQSLTADILVVAGGGGSSQHQGGGGGAGGLVAYSSRNLSSTNYTVTVGAGGTGVLTSTRGGNGSNSQFSSLSASIGGGGGGSAVAAIQTGLDGGSGGGGGGRNTGDSGINAGGLGTSGQGNNGGTGTGSDSDAKQGWRGGGGGGAGAVGGNALDASQMAGFSSGIIGSGNGGNGINTYSSWANITGTGVNGFFAGGGAGGGNSGGGTGGSGGGGNGGGTSTSGNSGVSNSGGGAGGAGNGTVIANGGSGIIIVRYPV